MYWRICWFDCFQRAWFWRYWPIFVWRPVSVKKDWHKGKYLKCLEPWERWKEGIPTDTDRWFKDIEAISRRPVLLTRSICDTKFPSYISKSVMGGYKTLDMKKIILKPSGKTIYDTFPCYGCSSPSSRWVKKQVKGNLSAKWTTKCPKCCWWNHWQVKSRADFTKLSWRYDIILVYEILDKGKMS